MSYAKATLFLHNSWEEMFRHQKIRPQNKLTGILNLLFQLMIMKCLLLTKKLGANFELTNKNCDLLRL